MADTPILLDSDPIERSDDILHFMAGGDEFAIQTIVDVEPLIESNKARFNAHDERTPFGDMPMVASIPNVIWFELEKQGITRDPKRLKKWLNDPDNAAFRTRPGRV